MRHQVQISAGDRWALSVSPADWMCFHMDCVELRDIFQLFVETEPDVLGLEMMFSNMDPFVHLPG